MLHRHVHLYVAPSYTRVSYLLMLTVFDCISLPFYKFKRRPYAPIFSFSSTQENFHRSKTRTNYRLSDEEKMMNVVALCLLVTSLVTAGFWSPAPEKHDQDVNVVVKDGHRVVVVEYDEDGHPNTKVSISPEHEILASATEMVGDEAVNTAEIEKTGRAFAPRELICDAFGKCKHRISATLDKAKDKVI